MGGAVGAPARTRTLGAAPSITNSAQPGCAQAAPRTHCVYTGARALLLLIWERVSERVRERDAVVQAQRAARGVPPTVHDRLLRHRGVGDLTALW